MSSVKLDGVLKAVKQVRGGVHVNHNKNTADCEVVRIPVPEKVLLPMQQHIGVPCTPTVKVGDKVSVGQIVGRQRQVRQRTYPRLDLRALSAPSSRRRLQTVLSLRRSRLSPTARCVFSTA